MKKTVLIVLLGGVFSHIYSQAEQDAQLWQKGELEFNISKHYGLNLSDEVRLTDNMSDLSYFYLDLGNIYKINNSLRMGLDYIWVEKEKKDGFSTRHQYNFYFTCKHKFHRFLVYDRILTEGQYVDNRPASNGEIIQDKFLRDKITLRYKLKKKIYPYVEDEIYYRMDRQSSKNPDGFDRNRLYLGVLYNMTHDMKLDFFSMYEDNFHVTPASHNFVYGIGFSRSFF